MFGQLQYLKQKIERKKKKRTGEILMHGFRKKKQGNVHNNSMAKYITVVYNYHQSNNLKRI